MASRDGVPFIVRTDHGKLSREALERLPRIQTPKEEWLQALLDQGPDLLPMQEIDDRIRVWPILSEHSAQFRIPILPKDQFPAYIAPWMEKLPEAFGAKAAAEGA